VSAGLDKRERVALHSKDIPGALEAISNYESIREAVILSTCGRVELYAASEEPERAKKDLRDFITSYHGVSWEDLEGSLYCHEQAAAVSHLFSVTSGLNSMVIGENQILHQAKVAYQEAKRCELTGKVFNSLFQRSFKVAKRIRVETEIAKRPVSVSSVAVRLAERTLGGLKGKTVMIVGAGKMGELTARCLVSSGASSLLVVNRTLSRARELADRLSGRALPHEALPDGLLEADVVISSAAAPHFVITTEHIRSAMARRDGRPVFIVDIAVPRNVEPAVELVDGVHLCNIDGLQCISSDNLVLRKRELAKCHSIIRKQTSEFMRWLKLQEVSPVISDISRHLRNTCMTEIDHTLSKLDEVSDKTRAEMEWLAYRISKRLSSAPIAYLKRQCAQAEPDTCSMLARELFGLQPPERQNS
jgi:glutamyl-tRNA reductase